MRYTKSIETISALLSSTLVVVFEKWFSLIIIHPIFALLLAIISAAVSGIIFESIFEYLPRRVYLLRKNINPMAKYEGVWIQIHSNTNEYVICNIEYSPEIDRYIFVGQHFTKNDYIVKFTSKNIHYDESLGGFNYLVEGQHDNGEFIKCWGYVSFEHEFSTKKYHTGKGSFIEIGSSLSRVDFKMIKAENKFLKNISNSSTSKIKEEICRYIEQL